MRDRNKFYQEVVNKLIFPKSQSILVCGAGDLDKRIFEESGFENVTISNLDVRANAKDFAPFKWSFQNAESLSFVDKSFDYVIIHAAIHHASVPHKVLTEMYRVAKKGVLAFEARDSLLMRFLERLELTQIYEHAAVYFNDCRYGGVNNTEIPNFVFRWTEREVEKTIQAYAPYYKHKITYKYGSAFPCTPDLEIKGQIKSYILKFLRPFYWLFSKAFPRQQNLFAFFVEKPQTYESLFPWLKYDKKQNKVTFNKEWGQKKYKEKLPFVE